MFSKFFCFLFISGLFFVSCEDISSKKSLSDGPAKTILKALIIDGENNHGVWPKTTMMLKDYLEETKMFEVDIARTAFTWQGGAYSDIEGVADKKDLLTMYPLEGVTTTSVEESKPDPNFSPDFDDYDVVISNMGWGASTWTAETKSKLENYMSKGGGFVAIHAANNSWGDWLEYNKMIGIGGWGGRNTESGPYVYYDEHDQLHYDKSEGGCGSHGPQFEFVLKNRAPEHPVMKGLPLEWLHTKDELYERLRGPAENMTVLATAFSAKESSDSERTGRHEPMLSAIEYGKGRIFHSALGHMDYSMECVGFITTFQRGAEWAATGKVTQSIPEDFPDKNKVVARKWNK